MTIKYNTDEEIVAVYRARLPKLIRAHDRIKCERGRKNVLDLIKHYSAVIEALSGGGYVSPEQERRLGDSARFTNSELEEALV